MHVPVLEPGLARVQTAVVLNTAAAGPNVRMPMGACRVQIALHSGFGLRWAGPPSLRIDPPEGWLAEGRRFELEQRDGVWWGEVDLSTPPLVIGPPPEDDGSHDGSHEGDGPDDGGPPGFTAPPSEIPACLVLALKVGNSDELLQRRLDFSIRIDLPAPGPPGGDGPSEPVDEGSDGHGKR